MYLVGPLSLRLVFQAFVVVVGVLMLAGAVNTAIVGSNGVLNRVSEDGIPPHRFRDLPSPLRIPRSSPQVSIQFTERRLLDLACQGAQGSVVISVQLYLCRDRWLCLLEALKAQSLVIVGGRARRWPTKETKLARMLQFAGHHVNFADLA